MISCCFLEASGIEGFLALQNIPSSLASHRVQKDILLPLAMVDCQTKMAESWRMIYLFNMTRGVTFLCYSMLKCHRLYTHRNL